MDCGEQEQINVQLSLGTPGTVLYLLLKYVLIRSQAFSDTKHLSESGPSSFISLISISSSLAVQNGPSQTKEATPSIPGVAQSAQTCTTS